MMRIIATSDLHVGDKGKINERRLAIAQEIAEQGGDVLLFGGDMADSLEHFLLGFETLSHFKGQKLCYLGNNDLECLDPNASHKLGIDHEVWFQDKLAEFGFSVLDHAPVVYQSVAFIGNSGWYDGTLWRPSPSYKFGTKEPFDPTGKNKATRGEMSGEYDIWLRSHFGSSLPDLKSLLPPVKTHDFLTDRSCRQLDKAWREIRASETSPEITSIVVGIHHIASPDFLKYAANPKFDNYNFGMGSTRLAEFYSRDERIRLALCGHTHRDDAHIIGDRVVQNISTTNDHPYWVFEI